MKPRRVFIFLVLFIIGLITVAFIGILNDAPRLGFVVWAREICDYLGDSEPWVFFTAFVILPLFGFPVSLFYFIAAELYGRVPSVLFVGTSLMVHLGVVFWIASKLFRGLIANLISRSRYHLPQILPSEYVKITVALRISPGVPFFVQNYLLGLGGIPFSVFFFVSWPIQFLWAVAFILLGESAFEGNLSIGLMSVCFIIALGIITKIVRERLSNCLHEYDTATSR